MMRRFVERVVDRVLCALRALWYLGAVTSRGHGIRVRGGVWVRNAGRLSVGNRVAFHAGPVATELTTQPGGRLEIGDDVMINYGCSFNASQLLQIGNRCRIGIGVVLSDSHLHREEPERRGERPEPKTLVIEDDVWLANRVIVLPGVRLGRGCIVGAGSVVTASVPANMLAAGNPARVIRPISVDGRDSLTSTLAEGEKPFGSARSGSGMHPKVGSSTQS